jgi:hypothetical protein
MREELLFNVDHQKNQLFCLLQMDQVALKFCPTRKFKDNKVKFAIAPENLSLGFRGDFLDQ